MPGDLNKQLAQQAEKLGFNVMGVADPAAFEQLPPVVADFGREYRFPNPRQVMEECRAVVVVGLHVTADYFDAVATRKDLRAQVYGEIIGNRSLLLADWLRQQGYVAAAADKIALKRAAVLAGLGRVGKNTLIAHPRLGSDVRWGAVLTDAPLTTNPAGNPMDGSLCGECEVCIKSCPAGALTPYKLDFDRCLVPALNRAEKGSEQWTLAQKHNRRLDRDVHLECNLCQKVCPLNGSEQAGASG